MKKYINILACVLAGLTASCTDTTTIGPDKYVEPATLDVSSNKLIFDADGGLAAVVVATTLPAWNYTTTDTWFSIEKKENNILEISAPLNTGGKTRTGSIALDGEKDGVKISATITLAQGSERSINLSVNGTSNCYIAQTNTAYTFNASIKGNGSDNDKSTYVKLYGLDIKGVAYADLLWEARNDADMSMSREIIDGVVIYKEGTICFHTGRSQGNAVIAVKDINGNILWSWHIWVCDDPITSHKQINSARKPAGEVMDRNLGALNNTPMDVNNRGMFYQWGRKDPFMPSYSPYDEKVDGLNPHAANQANPNIGNGTGKWSYNVTTLPLVYAPGNIPNAILNPMSYLMYYFSEYYDWYCASRDESVSNSDLWDEQKTLFDPCPVGYKVPGKDVWSIPSGNIIVDTGGKSDEYDANGENIKYDWNIAKQCGRCWKYTGDYYPMVGNIYYNALDKTSHNYASGQAFYWTCHKSPNTSTVTSYRMDFNPYWGTYRTADHVFSAQIRCVKE